MENESGEEVKHRILCAALYYDDGKEYPHQPKNVKTGMVICGRRHCNCFVILSRVFPERNKRAVTQGFLTSADLFVNRREAGVIAMSANQIRTPTECLFSEDLY